MMEHQDNIKLEIGDGTTLDLGAAVKFDDGQVELLETVAKVVRDENDTGYLVILDTPDGRHHVFPINDEDVKSND